MSARHTKKFFYDVGIDCHLKDTYDEAVNPVQYILIPTLKFNGEYLKTPKNASPRHSVIESRGLQFSMTLWRTSQ